MAITQTICNSFKLDLLKGQQDFDVDTFKIALYTSATTLDKNTTTYGSPTNEVSGTGYTAGGNTLTGVTTSLATDTAIVDFADTSWSSATITARGALIYNSTASGAAVAVLDFVTDQSSTNGTFTIQFPAAASGTAIIRIA